MNDPCMQREEIPLPGAFYIYISSIPGSGRSPGEGNGNPLQFSCLENPMDRGTWQATVHVVAKSWTQLSDFTLIYNMYAI